MIVRVGIVVAVVLMAVANESEAAAEVIKVGLVYAAAAVPLAAAAWFTVGRLLLAALLNLGGRARRRRQRWTPEQLAARKVLVMFGRPQKRHWNRYLETEWWASVRQVVLERAGGRFGRCEECGKENWLEVHHRHYLTLCFEDPELDLDALCRGCHDRRPRLRYQRIRVGPRTRWADITEVSQAPRRRRDIVPVRHHVERRRTREETVRHDPAGDERVEGANVDPAWVFVDPDDGVGL